MSERPRVGRSGRALTVKAGLALALAAVVGLVLYSPVERRIMVRRHIDREWFRRSLVEDNLAHWLASAPTESGFLRASLDRQWRPAADQLATLVSQSRLLFVMAAGYDVTGDEAYRAAVRKGADFLLAHFRDAEHGGWVWSVTPEGEVKEDWKSAYGHAFVIFGLSHAARVTGERRYADAALETWETMKAGLRDGYGGIKNGTSRDWTTRRGGNTQNPIMHLFEALLALYDATRSDAVLNDARELADFVFTRLYQGEGGYLPEMYDDEWRPLPDEGPGYIDLGHQFEWAFLLSRAVEKGFPRRYLEIGGRLLDFGMNFAYDKEAGGIFGQSFYDGRVKGQGRPKVQGGPGTGDGAPRPPVKGWWQQAEHLRALMRYAAEHERPDLWPVFDKSLAFVKAQFIDQKYGGWYGLATPVDPGETDAGRKGSPWMAGYHTAGMYLEALRLAE